MADTPTPADPSPAPAPAPKVEPKPAPAPAPAPAPKVDPAPQPAPAPTPAPATPPAPVLSADAMASLAALLAELRARQATWRATKANVGTWSDSITRAKEEIKELEYQMGDAKQKIDAIIFGQDA